MKTKSIWTIADQRIEKNKTRQAYYRKNAPSILRKQKESYKEAKAKEKADFEQLKSAETQLMESFKKEAKKIISMLLNKVFLCFLRHVVDSKKNVKIDELMSTSPSGRILSVDSLENAIGLLNPL